VKACIETSAIRIAKKLRIFTSRSSVIAPDEVCAVWERYDITDATTEDALNRMRTRLPVIEHYPASLPCSPEYCYICPAAVG